MILDSAFLIDLLADDEDALRKLTELVLRSEPLSVSTLTVMEVEVGLEESDAQQFGAVMDRLDPAAFDVDIAHAAASLQRRLRSEGQPIGTVDAMIAATALADDGVVVTRNTDEFDRVEGLTVEDY